MKALITGSFDPITKGHTDIIWKAGQIFGGENITIAVMRNHDKNHLLRWKERLALVKEAIPNYFNVVTHTGMLNDLIEKYDEVVIVRGLRNSADYEYEKTVEAFTREFDTPTIYINSSPETQHISSSLIRNLIKADAGHSVISPLMPDIVTYELMESFLSEDDKL